MYGAVNYPVKGDRDDETIAITNIKRGGFTRL